MEKNDFLAEASSHVAELHNIARNLETNHVTRDVAYKIRAVADEIHVNVNRLKHDPQR